MRDIRHFALALLLCGAVLPPALAGDDRGKEVAKDLREVGKTIGEAGKDVGLEIADAAKKVWYKGKKVSRPLLEDVRAAARDVWGRVIDGKNKTVARLREENEELRRRLAERGDAE